MVWFSSVLLETVGTFRVLLQLISSGYLLDGVFNLFLPASDMRLIVFTTLEKNPEEKDAADNVGPKCLENIHTYILSQLFIYLFLQFVACPSPQTWENSKK